MPISDKYWDKAAERYAKSPVSDEATYQRKLAETQEFFTPHMRIAEFGCGTGTTAIAHAPYVTHIDAIDISENMLQIGKGKAIESGIENITFSLGTLADLNAKEESLDAVLGLNVIHLIEDRKSLFAEVARVLKPGGVFVSSTVCLGKSAFRFLKLLVPIGKLVGLMPDLYVLTEEELAKEVVSSGFKIERQWRHAKDGISVFMIASKV
ncbi:class I SAM-dependent methyltransferase [Vacuolonema iberomarrocanum]|uniref:class I SAM-dependent methyltransferase n=1 Tax=Vacuolonema iberomarrocanum TaxID=3454632 RepID=UPI0019FF7B20|nr:class I SAM-dependent methyltransferase [filamentous cyanobacterium LEGE 07170]